MRLKPRNLIVTLAALSLVGAGWFFLAPAVLGGSTTYVVTHGNSMEPEYHDGDLVVVRPADGYHVGDVAAYRSGSLHTIVLHRIVGRDGDRYVFKGDHNHWLDSERPTSAPLVGSVSLH